ncbi:amidohydrolase family protein [Pseudemcibacter aquimaris]|uniref:amidohydrolase family protein n=1 Tax=Pseudemcibacter aquimaris TaxID=2857064 RepID=UPI002011B980|nr:amidohydrolase family protein [Pseudemcibacter aquimaris]MCC3861088.1 amidohydrolase family protein [Pseudemcibacter aquimaris]WDU59906.1 amidohydrolase family protein [Pseudemcibacter aquimaris]
MRILAIILAFIATPVFAETIAITGGKIHVGNGSVIENGTVLIDDGEIIAVGADVDVPSDARVINASGKEITPGIINPSTSYGLSEGAGGKFGTDTSANNSGMTASFDVKYALNRGSVVIQEGRRQGVTRAVSAPGSSGDIFSGSSALITMDNQADMNFAEGAMHAKFGNAANRAVAWNRIRAIFDQTLDYDRNRSRALRGQAQDYLLSVADMDALVPVLDGDKPLVIEMGSEAEIRGAIQLKNDYDINIVIQGGQEAWKVAAELAEAEIPVIIHPEHNTNGNVTMAGSTFSNAKRLHEAGVTFAIYSGNGSLYYGHHVLQFAGMAVAHGLDYDAAIQAITLNPAVIFGFDDIAGSIEEGKSADIVVWDGDPLEVTSNTDHVIVRGVEYELVSRRTMLRDRYLNLDRGDHFGKRYQGQ